MAVYLDPKNYYRLRWSLTDNAISVRADMEM